MTNEELIREYPFLAVVNQYDGKPVDDACWIDSVPEGWRDAFIRACGRIKARLLEIGKLDTYMLSDVKEKFGSLRVYDNLVDVSTLPPNDTVSDILLELEAETSELCITCGRPADYLSMGWVAPYCRHCKDKVAKECSYVQFQSFAKRRIGKNPAK